MKWLAAGVVALLVLVALLWWQLRAPADAASAAPVAKPASAAEVRPPASFASASQKLEAEAATVQPGKIDPASDAFTYAFDEAVPPMLTAHAASCYTGGLHRVARNAFLRLVYNLEVKDGEVTVHDLKVAESTLGDAALEACFAREVAATHWHNDQLPDWKQEDELVIRPERGMKKVTPDNLDSQGSGPVEPVTVQPKAQPSSREMPTDQPRF